MAKKYGSEMIKLAQSWIGRNESDGTHKYIIDIYNNHKPRARNYAVKYTDAWCATTISALAIKLGYTDIIPTECSCQYMIELFKQKGIWVENENRTPNPADIIFYDWQDNGKGDNTGWSDHVGLVEKVENGKITVIEGNYSNAVKRRTIAVNAKTIRGYGVPKYDKEVVTTVTFKEDKSVEEVAKEVFAGKWGNNPERKVALEKAGYDYEEVRAKVNELSKSTSSSSYYPRYTGTSGKIDTVLKAIGVSSTYIGSYKKRKPIATANGISNYTGTASQNTKLVNLAKQGKLVKS